MWAGFWVGAHVIHLVRRWHGGRGGKGAKAPLGPSEDMLGGDWTAALEQVRAGKTALGIPSVYLELENRPRLGHPGACRAGFPTEVGAGLGPGV